VALLALTTGATQAGVLSASDGRTGRVVEALVMGARGQQEALTDVLAAAGAIVIDDFPSVDGRLVRVDASQLAALGSSSVVAAISVNNTMHAEAVDVVSMPASYDVTSQAGSMYQTARRVGAPTFWDAGITGAGVDVAVVDTGISESAFGLAGRVVGGTDTTGAGTPLRDNYGHGTHLAGIIAANSGGAIGSAASFNGVAPDARLISVRVADDGGATSTAQVIAGLDWVLANRSANGMNIRVVNLAFGAPPASSYGIDPLSVAVERLWFAGIVVVASAGNGGPWGGLAAPAYDPFVIAVGAADSRKTIDGADDVVAGASSANESPRGRTVDLVAPGRSIQSSRAGSVGTTFPRAVISDEFLRGSGTSQSAAVVTGGVALVLSQRPSLAPDQVKYLLQHSAERLTGADRRRQGAGILRLDAAFAGSAPNVYAPFYPANGPGYRPLDGDWDGSRWAGSRWAGSRWASQAWMTLWK
jgi:serine protease AprX